MRFLKAARIGLAIVLVISLGAGVYRVSRIDQDALVSEARTAIKNVTGRTISAEGSICGSSSSPQSLRDTSGSRMLHGDPARIGCARTGLKLGSQ